MSVIRDIIHKMFVIISNREDPDLISVCNVCLGLFVQNLRISTLLNIVSICFIHIHKLIFIPIYLLLWVVVMISFLAICYFSLIYLFGIPYLP